MVEAVMNSKARRSLGRLLASFGCGGVVCGLLLRFVPVEPFMILFLFAAVAAAGASTTLLGGPRETRESGNNGN
jgi:hypothetical protein